MVENQKSFLYEDLRGNPQDIKLIIKTFSAYLNEYDRDYKYNYKFLVSHIEDFEKALLAHKTFEEQCKKIINELEVDKEINNEFKKIKKSNEQMNCTINFNNVLTYPIKKILKNKSPWEANGAINRSLWDDIISKNKLDINLYIDFRYEDIHFSKRYYSVDVNKQEHIKNIHNFFNEAYKLVLESKIGKDNIDKIKLLRYSINDEYAIKVSIDDFQSYYPVMSNYELKYFGSEIIKSDNNKQKKVNWITISGEKLNYSFSIKEFKRYEELKVKIKSEIDHSMGVKTDE